MGDIKRVDIHNTERTYFLLLNSLKKSDTISENKKLIILFTDGLPQNGVNHYYELQEMTKNSIVNIKNHKVEFFTIFYKNMEYYLRSSKRHVFDVADIVRRMRELFKNGMYETENFKDVEKILTKKLYNAVERINQSG